MSRLCLICYDPIEADSPYWADCCGAGVCQLCARDLLRSDPGPHDLTCDSCGSLVQYQIVQDDGLTEVEPVERAMFGLRPTPNPNDPDYDPIEADIDWLDWDARWQSLVERANARYQGFADMLQDHPPRPDHYGLDDCQTYLRYTNRVSAIQRHLPHLPKVAQVYLVTNLDPSRHSGWRPSVRSQYQHLERILPICVILPSGEPSIGPPSLNSNGWGISEQFHQGDLDVFIVPHAQTGMRVLTPLVNDLTYLLDAWVPSWVRFRANEPVPPGVEYVIYRLDEIEMDDPDLALRDVNQGIYRMPRGQPIDPDELEPDQLASILGMLEQYFDVEPPNSDRSW